MEKAQENITEDIELHRPYVDDVHLTCPVCGKPMTRIPEVMDCWFDSGAMPFAQQHYPFENSENFDEELFPADFICEGIDQTRGWFYSLMAISTFIKGKAPYKNVLVNDLILDKHGKKMSHAAQRRFGSRERLRRRTRGRIDFPLCLSSRPPSSPLPLFPLLSLFPEQEQVYGSVCPNQSCLPA